MEKYIYRYPHPVEIERWVYVGQTVDIKSRDQKHRYGRTAFGRSFRTTFPEMTLPMPVICRVRGTAEEINKAEEQAIEQYQTSAAAGGFNKTKPGSLDYRLISLLGNKAVKPESRVRGGKEAQRLYGCLFTSEQRSRGGLKNAASGHLARVRSFQGSSKGGKVGAVKTNCLRWHVNRGNPCVCGGHDDR